ncbi:hypothetical protein BJP34_26905 [Moorena producens PAL-8-15-08-1]|uniref:Uncharacterized protein n=1 Tax=Moorena producens PAL-8-15-08-1 TaxID=1458985 RepID=A0A1D8TY54_9CYAN|nr:hypothetical protein BJP34_26905 [Moorena producens PAL-8-15-08-1]
MVNRVLNEIVSAKEPFNSYETVKEAVETNVIAMLPQLPSRKVITHYRRLRDLHPLDHNFCLRLVI